MSIATNHETIESWVDYIQTLHSREIDLSLDRVREVYDRLLPNGVVFKVIIVAGTNGKGSTCELLTSIYHQSGYSTGKYTSPHLQFFNERFSINRQNISDDDLLEAFSSVETARGSIGLTFFEFGTLVAIELFTKKSVDVAILEVGLGGRLDAVNILDADIAVITSISIDHTDWLGNTLPEIALEKIAVSRPNRPCVIGITKPPKSMIEYCQQNNVPTYQLGQDFNCSTMKASASWDWLGINKKYENLPLPYSQSGVQLDNASVALQVINLMEGCLPINAKSVSIGIEEAELAARCQLISGFPKVIIDVAHNTASVLRLAEFVKGQQTKGKIVSICGMLKDKEIEQSLSCLFGVVDVWNFVDIHHPRGSDAKALEKRAQTSLSAMSKTRKNSSSTTFPTQLISYCFGDAASAYKNVLRNLNNVDTLIVFGSFFVVSDIMQFVSADADVQDSQNTKLI